MCAPCKIILNSGGITGTLSGIERAIDNLNRRGYDIPEATYHKGLALICGFHAELQEFEKAIAEGPYVPFEHKTIPLPK